MTVISKEQLAGAFESLQNGSTIILEPNGLFPVRLSPDLAGILFLSYWITPRQSNWSGVALVPVFTEKSANGALAVEVVSPERKILCQQAFPLAQVESMKPVAFHFPAIRDSQSKTYELRVIARNLTSPLMILENRFLPPNHGMRRWRARPMCKLTFDEQSFSSVWEGGLTLELAQAIGSRSFEDHYWSSGWQTANVQLVTELKANDSILDIGCGVGRLAFGLHGWYAGRYVGTDIVSRFIEFCKQSFPRFEFYQMDIKSPYYNPQGSMEPEQMVLPVQSQDFDVAVLYSVYTHLLPQALIRMTSEVSRVLKPGGRCLATFLLLDDQTDQAIFSFRHAWSEDCRVESQDSPEAAVGYRKDFITSTFANHGLHLKTYYPGSWTGRPGLTLQDQLLFTKDR
jgi:SAM-dependent methyltransferase